MEEGKAAVQAEDYEGALGHFKEAQTEAPNNKAANAAIEQTELTILAEKAAAEDDLRAALAYYEKIASVENGIEFLTTMAQELVIHIGELEEKLAEVENLLEADDSEAALEVLDRLDKFAEDKTVFKFIEKEVAELKEKLQINLLFSKIKGYAQKDVETTHFCQIREEDLMCAILTIDIYAYRDIVAIHLESEDSLRLETNRKDEEDFIISKIKEDSFYINDQKYDIVSKDYVEKTGAEMSLIDYTVQDIFNKELMKELEAAELGLDYFYNNEDKSDQGHTETVDALQSYSKEEIEYARVWLDYNQQFGNPPYPELSVSFWKKGDPISRSFEENSALFPEDVVVLRGHFTADGRLVYSSNGDGTINLYDIPSHWPAEPEMEGGVKAYTQKIADNPTRKKIADGDANKVLAILETMSIER